MEVSTQKGNDETAETHLTLEEKDRCHERKMWGHRAQGNPAAHSSNLHRAETPTYGRWRRPASLRPWHGHPAGGTGTRLETRHPATHQEVAVVREAGGGRRPCTDTYTHLWWTGQWGFLWWPLHPESITKKKKQQQVIYSEWIQLKRNTDVQCLND